MRVKGVPMVKSPTGTYAPLPGGALISPHDAFFAKERVTPVTGDFLVGTNETLSKLKGYAGPYAKGVLYDLLSNQGFEYRLYVMFKGEEPQFVRVVFQNEQVQRELTLSFVKQ